MVKRFAPFAKIPGLDVERFPSTSSIASADFRSVLLRHWNDLGDAILAHLDELDAIGLQPNKSPETYPYLNELTENHPQKERFLRYDGDYFYRAFFTPEQVAETIGKDFRSLSISERKQISAIASSSGTLGKLLKTVKELAEKNTQIGISSPWSYYAVLKMDGDNMGKLISQAESLTEHQQISRALAEAAREMRRIVEDDHPGRLIYSGGDDALALMPMDCSLQVADQLRSLFEKKLQGIGKSDQHASSGIAIVHHIQPLEGSLQFAREAEKTAKGIDTFKNAFVVKTLRRSGEDKIARRRWWTATEYLRDPIDWVRELMLQDFLAAKFAHEVWEEAGALAGTPIEAQQKELERLLKRHRNPKWDNAEEHKQIAASLAELANALPDLKIGREVISSTEQMAQWLLVARFLAQGGGE
jgi:CRISPR-associated protein Cmr2